MKKKEENNNSVSDLLLGIAVSATSFFAARNYEGTPKYIIIGSGIAGAIATLMTLSKMLLSNNSEKIKMTSTEETTHEVPQHEKPHEKIADTRKAHWRNSIKTTESSQNASQLLG